MTVDDREPCGPRLEVPAMIRVTGGLDDDHLLHNQKRLRIEFEFSARQHRQVSRLWRRLAVGAVTWLARSRRHGRRGAAAAVAGAAERARVGGWRAET